MHIEIVNWEKYQKRQKDIKRPFWFAFSNSFFDDPENFDLSHSAIAFWLYLLCLASKKGSKTVCLNKEHAKRIGGFTEKQLESIPYELCDRGMAMIRPRHGPDPAASRPLHARPPQDNTEQDKTRHDRTGDNTRLAPATAAPRPRDLFEVWNSHCGALPKCKTLSSSRQVKAARELKKPDWGDLEPWVEVVKVLASSSFALEKWRPCFDDFLNESKRVKALEGAYSGESGQKTREQLVSKENQKLLEKINRGEFDAWE